MISSQTLLSKYCLRFHASPRHSRASKQNAYPSSSSKSRDYTLIPNTKKGGFTLRCFIANWDVSNGIVSTLLCRQHQISADACSVDESDCLQWQRSCCIKKDFALKRLRYVRVLLHDLWKERRNVQNSSKTVVSECGFIT